MTGRGRCAWLRGDGRGPKGWDQCEANAQRGRPYCVEHCARAYRKGEADAA